MNCWYVLGMVATTDVKAIKKRYADLVKEYHPEDHPEEYQKIVAAYKAAVADAKARKRWQQKYEQDVAELEAQEISEQEPVSSLDFSLDLEEAQEEVQESAPELDFSTVEPSTSQEIPQEDEEVGLDFSHYEDLDVGRISEELDRLLEMRHANVTEQLVEWRAFFNRYKGQEVLLYDLLETKDIYQITHESIIGLIYWYFQEAKTKKQYSYDLQKMLLWNELLSSDTRRSQHSDEQLKLLLESIYESELFLDSILADVNLINDFQQWKEYFKQKNFLSSSLFDKLAERYHLITNTEIFDQWFWAFGTKASGFYWMTEERAVVFQQMREHYYRLRYPNSSETAEKLYQKNLTAIKVYQWLFLGISLLFLSTSIFLRTDTPWLYYALLSLIPYETFVSRFHMLQGSLIVPRILTSYWIIMGGITLFIALLFWFFPTLSAIFFAITIHWVYMRKHQKSSVTLLKGNDQVRYFIPISVGIVVAIFFSLSFQDFGAIMQILMLSCFAWFVANVRLIAVVSSNTRLKTKYLLWPAHFVKEWLLPSVGAIVFVWLLSVVSLEFFREPYRFLPYAFTVDYRPFVMVMCLALLGNLFLMGTFSERIRSYVSVWHLRMLTLFLLVILVRMVAIWYVFIEDIRITFWSRDVAGSLLTFLIIELCWIISYCWIKKEIKRNGDQFNVKV